MALLDFEKCRQRLTAMRAARHDMLQLGVAIRRGMKRRTKNELRLAVPSCHGDDR